MWYIFVTRYLGILRARDIEWNGQSYFRIPCMSPNSWDCGSSRNAFVHTASWISLQSTHGFKACVASYPPGGVGLCDALRSFLRVRWSACIHYLLAKQHGTGGSARSFGIADFHDHCTGGFHPWLVGQHCDLGGAHCHFDRPLPSVREAHLWGTNGQVSGLSCWDREAGYLAAGVIRVPAWFQILLERFWSCFMSQREGVRWEWVFEIAYFSTLLLAGFLGS